MSAPTKRFNVSVIAVSETGERVHLGQATVDATSMEDAHRAAHEKLWDDRLDAASCSAEYEAEEIEGEAVAEAALDFDHPNDYRPIFREVMRGDVRLGHLATDGYHDHAWTFYPDPRLGGRRPTRAKSADPTDALPNWVRRDGFTVLSAEASEAIYAQTNETGEHPTR